MGVRSAGDSLEASAGRPHIGELRPHRTVPAGNDFVARAGSYVHEQAGATHTLIVPDDNTEETEVIFVVEGGNVYFDDDGTYLGFDDGHAVLERYLRNCDEQGFARPDDILV